MRIQGIDFVSLPVQDLDRAIAFYRDVLGMRLHKHTEGKWAELEMADGSAITLYPFATMGDTAFVPSKALALRVEDVAAALPALKAAGCAFPWGEAVMDSGFCRSVAATDPEGNQLYFHHRYLPEEG